MTISSRRGISARSICAGVVVFMVAVLAPVASVGQGGQIGTCQPSELKFRTAPMTSGEQSTTSTTFINVSETVLNFTQGGASPSCIVVEFSALAFAPGSNKMSVRALLNNTTTAEPGPMIFATNDNAAGGQAQARAVNFVFPLISPGAQTLQMQFRSVNGGAVRIGRHSTIVRYIP